MSERFYVTTPIYYLNAEPHVGTAYTTIVADTLARYHRLRGHDTYFLTGTDEHGQKIERKAEEKGVPVTAHVDGLAQLFRDLWPKLDIAPDDFIRTTDPRHEARAQELWRRVQANGDIYLGHYEGWYCTADEAFYTEKELVDGLSPTGRPVERLREESYFFRLSKYADRLLALYDRSPPFIEPESRMNEVRSFVKGGLEDLSVSRTSFRWGIPVPGDERHVMYVWFDALSNYWTALGDEGDPRQRFWPPDVQLMGKEITRFHCVYWPAFLMAAGFGDELLPRKAFAHGWLTVNGEKMSKSAGNMVDPVPLVAEVGPDALRYYLLRAVAFGQDGDFNHQDLLNRINSELGNDLGNLLNRTLGLCRKSSGSLTPAYAAEGDLEAGLRASAEAARRKACAELDAIAPHRALDAIWAFCRDTNAYVDRAAPWREQKLGNEARVGTILAALLEACRHLSVLLSPFIPRKALEMRVQLGLGALVPTVGEDLLSLAWQPRPAGEALTAGEPLFPSLDKDRQKEILARLLPAPAAEAQPEGPAQAAGAPAQPAEPRAAALPPVSHEQFSAVDLRVGVVTAAARVPKKDKLLDLRVDVGEPEPRRIIAGLALTFPPEALIGRRVVVVANLAPREFGKGLVSQGMLLAAGPSEALSLVAVPDGAQPGTKVK